MSEADDYRANAAACWRMANRSNEPDKHAWLEMAKAWSLLTVLRQPADERFDAADREHDTSRSLRKELELGDLFTHLNSHLPSL
jgi:hypothetical protein